MGQAGTWWWCVVAVVAATVAVASPASPLTRRGEPPSPTYTKTFSMPGVTPNKDDAYVCTVMALNSSVEEWVLKFSPLASANRAHHMLLYGCSGVSPDHLQQGSWDCLHHGICQGSRIMYAWAKNAPETNLPDGVGFRIGGQSNVAYLVLQIHYAHALPVGVRDHSGLKLRLTQDRQQYMAGIFLLASLGATIPPYTEKTHADMNCMIRDAQEPEPIHLFAYRVHAHTLGSVITGYLYHSQTQQYEELARGNPHWPQAFYPTTKTFTVQPTDIIHARCTWNSSARSRTTYIGSTSADEMCNLYIMYYTDFERGSEFGVCARETFKEVTKYLPADSDVPLPPNPLLEEHAMGSNTHQEKPFTYTSVNDNTILLEKKAHSHKKPQPAAAAGYPNQAVHVGEAAPTTQPPPPPTITDHSGRRKGKKLQPPAYHVVPGWGPGKQAVQLGQVTAVALDSEGHVMVFHRGEVSWDGSSFLNNNKLRNQNTPIQHPTLLHLNHSTGQLIHAWGKNFFYMPHGLTVDGKDNIWVTDVGLHQVFKLPPSYGDGKPLLTLGTRFEPGEDDSHFCKPTGVAVMASGEFFVSDGYCNARIIKYSPEGKVLLKFGQASAGSVAAPGSFRVPHALALAKQEEEVCVADRENGRVQCFTTTLGHFTRSFKFSEWGPRLFSMAYTPAHGGRLLAVNGPAFFGNHKVSVYQVDFDQAQLHSLFSPNNEGLSNPHDIAVSVDGKEVYVAEIGPNKLWKFVHDADARPTTPKPGLLQRISSFFTFTLS